MLFEIDNFSHSQSTMQLKVMFLSFRPDKVHTIHTVYTIHLKVASYIVVTRKFTHQLIITKFAGQ
jgi:hypothetical protein